MYRVGRAGWCFRYVGLLCLLGGSNAGPGISVNIHTLGMVEVVQREDVVPCMRSKDLQADKTGTEPLALHQHLCKSDPSLDDAYFAYLYTVLVEHPSIRVSLTQHPLASPDKTVRLGEAPLPDDYEIPDAVRKDVDISAMYLNGVKGRALAYHLAGTDFKSNAQAVEDRRELLKKNANAKATVAARKELERKKHLPQANLEEGLIRDLTADDGAGIAKEDLNGLAQRWGSRLRLRCTDEEIYYRLTGTHLKVCPLFTRCLR